MYNLIEVLVQDAHRNLYPKIDLVWEGQLVANQVGHRLLLPANLGLHFHGSSSTIQDTRTYLYGQITEAFWCNYHKNPLFPSISVVITIFII